ncbi:type II toxin-antitoxin system RelE family toxin [Microbacterium xylanilyticum]
MGYAIFYSRAAAKAFRGIHPQDRQRIKDAIEHLAIEPRPSGCLQLTGGEGEFRIRVGEYRIVYDVIDDRLEILVLRIAHRREVYR